MSDPRSQPGSGHGSVKRAGTPVREESSKFVRVRLRNRKLTLHSTTHNAQHQHTSTPSHSPQKEAYARKVTSCHLLICLRALAKAPRVLRAAFQSKTCPRNSTKTDFSHHLRQVGANPFEVNDTDMPIGLDGYGGGLQRAIQPIPGVFQGLDTEQEAFIVLHQDKEDRIALTKGDISKAYGILANSIKELPHKPEYIAFFNIII